ncbi:MAG TPA: dihydropteroate synthase [Gammaproteobacteria bacterium]|nr:dihydropteroate synthase [Gammaproteobacteria bacterium]
MKVCSILGILNVTPDSFFDGGKSFSTQKAIDCAFEMHEAGADFIDIGGESTRPESQPISATEELDRILPVIEAVASKMPVSVDTQKAIVMKEVLKHPVAMINDVNALRDPGALSCVARASVKLCLMHMKGVPQTMQEDPGYADVVHEVYGFLVSRVKECKSFGIELDRIILDPGFGFGKSVDDNYKLLSDLEYFNSLGCDVMIGMSRKSMIGNVLDLPVKERLNGGIVLACMALERGAKYIRTHDVKETKQAILLYQQLKEKEYVN